MNQKTSREKQLRQQKTKNGWLWTALTAVLLVTSVLGNVVMRTLLYSRFSSGGGDSYSAVQAERERLAAAYETVSGQYDSLSAAYDEMSERIQSQSEELERVQAERDELKRQLENDLLEEYAAQIDNLVQNVPYWFDAAGNFVKKEFTAGEPAGYTRASISVCYEDLESGRSWSCGGDMSYYSASLIKAPYVYSLLCEFAEARANKEPGSDLGIYDWDRIVTLTDAMKMNGSGTLKNMSAGTQLTVKELMQYAIEVSDNTAFKYLRDTYGYDFFYKKAKDLGVSSVYEGSFDTLSAEDACVFLRAIYEFASENDTEGQMLLDSMKKANYTVLIPQAAGDTETAHKYGWDAKAYHDMAIVMDERPYVLCIMTNFNFSENSMYREDINTYLREIITKVMEYHKQAATVDS